MPQNLKTEPLTLEGDERELDANEQKFVEWLGQIGNQTEAYARAYGEQNYSRAALRVQACRKASEPHIKAALSKLRAAGLANASLTVADRIETILAGAEQAKLDGNWGAWVACQKEVNELLGLKIERVMDVTEQDPVATLNAIANAVGVEAAQQLARENNIPWSPPIPENRTLN